MRRQTTDPRPNWQQRVVAQGLAYHSHETGPYWDESAYYEFRHSEIEQIHAATKALWDVCLATAECIIDNKLYSRLAIPPRAVGLIERSWNEDHPSIYGRFDLACDGERVKMFEFNADTPTSLIEAATVQWDWKQDKFPSLNQWTGIHELLVAQWTHLRPYLKPGPVHLASMDSVEDGMTITYLGEQAMEAGIEVVFLPIQQIGWDGSQFVDVEGLPIVNLFKLYPWENLIDDEFARYLNASNAPFVIEPAWKMLLSNKGFLAIAWELFPGNPYLLRTEFHQFPGSVRKPFIGREGANITLPGHAETAGPYTGPYVWQEQFTAEFDNYFPVIGSWLIGQEPAGLGIRESLGNPVTTNTSRFVPHVWK